MELLHKKVKIIKKIGDWQLGELTENESDQVVMSPTADYALSRAEFESCPFLDYILDGRDCLFILLNGSCAGKCIRERSDYDLEVFLADSCDPGKSNYCLFYKERYMHWYYKISTASTRICGLHCGSLMNYHWSDDTNILCVADSAAVDRFSAAKNALIDSAVKLFYQRQLDRHVIDGILNAPPDDTLARLGKLSWMIYFQACYLLNREPDFKLISDLKSIRYTPLSNERRKQFIAILEEEQEAGISFSEEERAELINIQQSAWRSIWEK